jgi:hypothetical protein
MKVQVGFFITTKDFLTNGTCMALLLLTLLIETTVFLTRGFLFWFDLTGWFI